MALRHHWASACSVALIAGCAARGLPKNWSVLAIPLAEGDTVRLGGTAPRLRHSVVQRGGLSYEPAASTGLAAVLASYDSTGRVVKISARPTASTSTNALARALRRQYGTPIEEHRVYGIAHTWHELGPARIEAWYPDSGAATVKVWWRSAFQFIDGVIVWERWGRLGATGWTAADSACRGGYWEVCRQPW